ncbi:MAG TPA: hypothetical protein VF861_16380 [Telluria sp.]
MKLFAIRSAAAATLLGLLTACGGSGLDAAPSVADGTALAPPVMDARPAAQELLSGMQPPPSNDQVPTPDCQSDNCQGLRVIDGNAEAYRFGAIGRVADTDSSI